MTTQLVLYITLGAIVLAFAIAGLVIYIGKNRARRFDSSSLPRGNAETEFSRRMTRRLQAKNEDEF